MQSLSPPSLYSILVNVFPPPWELPKKPLITLHWGHPEVKTLINILPAQQGKKKEALYLSGVLRSQEAVGGKEKEAGHTECLCVQERTPNSCEETDYRATTAI